MRVLVQPLPLDDATLELHLPATLVATAFLVIPALVIGSATAADSQNLFPALIILPAIGILLGLRPANEEFFRRGAALSRTLLAITLIAAVPLVAYALDMGAQPRDLEGPPHHVQRLATMASMALAIVVIACSPRFGREDGESQRGAPARRQSCSGSPRSSSRSSRAPWGVDGEAWLSREVSCLSQWPNGRSGRRRPLVSRAREARLVRDPLTKGEGIRISPTWATRVAS